MKMKGGAEGERMTEVECFVCSENVSKQDCFGMNEGNYSCYNCYIGYFINEWDLFYTEDGNPLFYNFDRQPQWDLTKFRALVSSMSEDAQFKLNEFIDKVIKKVKELHEHKQQDAMEISKEEPQFKEPDDMSHVDDVRNFKSFLLDELTLFKCPSCNIVVESLTGCNKAICSSCRTHFCWYCLGERTDID